MKFNIFDYASTPIEVEAPCKINDILALVVTIVSGDEIVDIVAKDGAVYSYDSSETRFDSYYDGSYILTDPNKIREWFEYERCEDDITLSYNRQREFECVVGKKQITQKV